MKIYKCKKTLIAEKYNEEGYWQPCQRMEIKPGTVLRESRKPLQIGAAPCIRLENKEIWLELIPDTLAEHFEEVC